MKQRNQTQRKLLRIKSCSIGGPKSAKRKKLIREYFETNFRSRPSFSDPFENGDDCDSDEFALSEFNFYSTIRFDSENSSDLEEIQNQVDPDGILIQPNLEEAEKFISSIKLSKISKNSDMQARKDAKPPQFVVNLVPREEIDAVKVESQKLDDLLYQDANGESEEDDQLL